MERKKAEEELLQRTATTRPRKGARARSSLGLREHRPKSAMSTLESIYTPHVENRKALHIPRQTKSFDLAIQSGRIFDDVDPSFAARQARLREKQLEQSIARRLELEHDRRETIRARRTPQRERFQSLAYGRFVASVRREEPHAVSQYRSARTSTSTRRMSGRGSSMNGSQRSNGSAGRLSWSAGS
jgi:hypothetical protein